MDNSVVKYETIVLEKIKFGLTRRSVGATIIGGLKIDWWNNYADKIVFDITGYVMGEKVDEINLPTSWWQMFKEQCFPNWLKRIWKVKYKDVCKIYATYPKLNQALPEDQQYVVFKKVTEERKVE